MNYSFILLMHNNVWLELGKCEDRRLQHYKSYDEVLSAFLMYNSAISSEPMITNEDGDVGDGGDDGEGEGGARGGDEGEGEGGARSGGDEVEGEGDDRGDDDEGEGVGGARGGGDEMEGEGDARGGDEGEGEGEGEGGKAWMVMASEDHRTQ